MRRAGSVAISPRAAERNQQARGQPVDRRADVFSLGVSLYEALTHYRPFSRENDLAILNAVLKCEFKPPRELRKDLPKELESIILKAVAREPEHRFETAEECLLALERGAHRPLAVPRKRPIAQRDPQFWLKLVAGVSLLANVILLSLLLVR